MKIIRLKVEGLFGLYDYDIDFARHGDEFTILTSPNGYGVSIQPLFRQSRY